MSLEDANRSRETGGVAPKSPLPVGPQPPAPRPQPLLPKTTVGIARRRKLGVIHWLKRSTKAIVPVGVWLGAVALAISIYPRRAATVAVLGYGENRAVTLSQSQVGLVRELRTTLHQVVEPGEILARVDDREDRLRLETLSADLVRLQKEVDAERAKLEFERAGMALDQRGLARQLLVDRESAHIQYLNGLITKSHDEALLSGTLVEQDILDRLYKQGHVNFRELNTMKTQIESIEAKVKATATALAQMDATFKDTDARWHEYRDEHETPPDLETVLTPVRLAVDVREREILEVTYRIDLRVLRSPIHGQVTEILVEAGDVVAAGTPMITVTPLGTQRIVAFVPEADAATIKPDGDVNVFPVSTAAHQPKIYPGRVTSLADAVTEAPLRYRRVPNWPVWGREVVVSLVGNERIMPGEAVNLVFQR